MTVAATVAGVGMTPFVGRTDDSLVDLATDAAIAALDDAGLDVDVVASLHVGNMLAEAGNHRAGLANALAAGIGLDGVSTDRVENTSASGASAFHRGVESILAGGSDAALVVGAEKMSAGDTAATTEVISRLTHPREYEQGLTLPSFGGLAADAYLRRYDVPREALAEVAVKNHANGARNAYAQFQTEIDVETALDSPLVAEPLRLYDCCPMTDGAAAMVLLADGGGEITVASTASATGSHAVAERSDPLDVSSVATAGSRAFARAGLDPGDVDVACIHDAFTILEWLELEELGFYEAGTAWRATVDGETARDGSMPVNPGGGLKARGHPLGATGISQLVELVWQLRGDADPRRQIDSPEVGFAINVAGFGNNSVCSVLTT
ncbi:thiolase C-terminal domain-containing protein [Haloferacaceae archaeon DSL9]